MSFLHKFLMIAPAACLLAQTPPPPPPATATPPPGNPPATAPAAPRPATPVPPGLLAPAPAPSKPLVVPPGRVVLTAGTVNLTAEQFDEIVDTLPENVRARIRAPGGRKQFADSLVKLYILADEGRRRKLDETRAYKIQSALYNDQVLATLVSDQVRADTKVDEAEVRKYYDDHKDTYEEVTARHILIRTKGAPTPVKPGAKELTDEESLAKANDLHKRIQAGEDFATLAKAESDDTTSSNGGLLPPFSHGRMVPSFEQAAFKLKPGEVSEPVKSQFGYHIIKVEAHTTKTFEEVRPQIEKILVPQKAQKTLDDMSKRAVYDPDFFAPPTPPGPRPSLVPNPSRPNIPPTAMPSPNAPPSTTVPPPPSTPPPNAPPSTAVPPPPPPSSAPPPPPPTKP